MCILNSYFEVVRLLNTFNIVLTKIIGGESMKQKNVSKNRNALKRKMASVFSENMQTLPTDLQGILLDDLVTAFENRLSVLNRAQYNVKLEMAESVECETVQA
jgi:hypothetical protein